MNGLKIGDGNAGLLSIIAVHIAESDPASKAFVISGIIDSILDNNLLRKKWCNDLPT